MSTTTRPHPIPILSDNYVWCHPAADGKTAWVVDPGDAAPVLNHLQRHGWTLGGILVTHWHPDHIGGIPALKAVMPCPVIGPRAESARIPTLTRQVEGGEEINLPIGTAKIIDLPGHTLGHIAFAIEEWLYCGDTLFCGGCGRLFEGTPEQMSRSLTTLAALPPQTHVACTHEYTLANLRFALTVEPDNLDLQHFQRDAIALRDRGQPTLPSSLARERAINPFMRCDVSTVRQAAEAHAGHALRDEVAVFATLRQWKDHF